jgi:hypothetical protein
MNPITRRRAARAAAARGAEYLTGLWHGPAWADAIDLGDLDMSYGGRCVLGQVYAGQAAADNAKNSIAASSAFAVNGFDWALFNLPGINADTMGFDAPYGNRHEHQAADFAALQAAWRPLVKAAQDAPRPPVAADLELAGTGAPHP